MRPTARIVLDEPSLPAVSWSWRESWTDGADSIYGLLSKFAHLNAIGARELVALFVRNDLRVKTSILREPDVDLRVIGPFDLLEFTKHLRLDASAVRRSFVGELLPNSEGKALPELQWCPRCLLKGLHLPIHQLAFISACPLHGVALTRSCPRCVRAMPYRLTRGMFQAAFSCPNCGLDLAAALKQPGMHEARLTPKDAARVADLVTLLGEEDRLLRLAFEFDCESRRRGNGRFGLGRADLLRSNADYAGFVTALMEHLKLGHSMQSALPLDRIVAVTRRLPVMLIDVKAVLKGRRRLPAKPSATPLCWTVRNARLHDIYRAIRRHLWKTVMRPHRHCFSSACRALWWELEGECTLDFCIPAMAFILWRMHWEGVAIPGALLAPNQSRPDGIAAWSQASVSIMRYNWSEEGEHWVMQHSFALSCIGRFAQCLDYARASAQLGRIMWDRLDFSDPHGRHWAITGNDSPRFPLVFFKQATPDLDFDTIRKECQPDAIHRARHLQKVSRIER